MSTYNQEFNKDNTVLRYIIVSLLAELKEKVYFYNQIDKDNLSKINIPFYYSVTGGERFLSDNFLYKPIDENYAIGDYEVVPRGIIELDSVSIDSSRQTNKFVRSEFVREYGGKLKTYSLETAYLPLDLGFTATVICSNNLEMLKATESIMSKLYKEILFQVDLGMFKIPGVFQVPDDYSQNKLFEFTLNDKKEFQVQLSLNVRTFMPVFQDGFLLSDIQQLTRNSTTNPNNKGIGLFRNGRLYFGGVLQDINYNIDDISKVPSDDILSNQSYNNKTGDKLLSDDVTSAKPDTESEESKKFRNDE
tara:strand:- start:23726 stop:24640 length:915 start_codon:yes stop_codon:yes gene_type:complete